MSFRDHKMPSPSGAGSNSLAGKINGSSVQHVTARNTYKGDNKDIETFIDKNEITQQDTININVEIHVSGEHIKNTAFIHQLQLPVSEATTCSQLRNRILKAIIEAYTNRFLNKTRIKPGDVRGVPVLRTTKHGTELRGMSVPKLEDGICLYCECVLSYDIWGIKERGKRFRG